jgi:hypothetical protein
MRSTNTSPTVWGVFVGDNGDQLEIFNSKAGPFPPEEETEGYIAIGWPAIGDLRMFRDHYADFVQKFRVVYPDDSERAFKTKANMPWYFAFGMKRGDWIIAPCSVHGLLLVGEVIGDYETDFHDESTLYGKKRPDFVHRRPVRWKFILPKADPRYGQLNRIGQLTVSRPHLTFDELQEILT